MAEAFEGAVLPEKVEQKAVAFWSAGEISAKKKCS